MNTIRLAALLLPLLLTFGALAYAQSETGDSPRSGTSETVVDERTAGDDRSEQPAERSASSNWLAWLIGLPLLAGLILVVLLLTRSRRTGATDEDEENE